jgi:excisionase family DNA binding protein
MKIVLGVKLYTLEEVGELLGVQTQTVSRYISQERLKSRIIGGRRYVSEENLKEFLVTSDK